MTDSEKLCCVACGEFFKEEELVQFGLVMLCPACKAEAEESQAMQSIMNGGCRDYQ